jgi:hypothetical protein
MYRLSPPPQPHTVLRSRHQNRTEKGKKKATRRLHSAAKAAPIQAQTGPASGQKETTSDQKKTNSGAHLEQNARKHRFGAISAISAHSRPIVRPLSEQFCSGYSPVMGGIFSSPFQAQKRPVLHPLLEHKTPGNGQGLFRPVSGS